MILVNIYLQLLMEYIWTMLDAFFNLSKVSNVIFLV